MKAAHAQAAVIMALGILGCDASRDELKVYETKKWVEVDRSTLGAQPIAVEQDLQESQGSGEVTVSGVKFLSSSDALAHLEKLPNLSVGMLYHEPDKQAGRNQFLERLVRIAEKKTVPVVCEGSYGKESAGGSRS